MLSLSKVSVSEDGTVTSEWTEQTMHSPPKDFERTGGGCRKFPVQFKLKVIDYVKAGHSNTATARHFKVNRKVVRDWLRKEEQLRRAAATEAATSGPSPGSLPRNPGRSGTTPGRRAPPSRNYYRKQETRKKRRFCRREQEVEIRENSLC